MLLVGRCLLLLFSTIVLIVYVCFMWIMYIEYIIVITSELEGSKRDCNTIEK
jgi:hypothetical protein